MGAAARVMALVVSPFPPLRPSVVLLHRRIYLFPCSPLRLLSVSSRNCSGGGATHLVKCYHSQTNSNSHPVHSSTGVQQHPWSEWMNFLNFLSNGQGFVVPEDHGIPPEDAFVVYEKLPDEFVRAAAACLAFSRARPELIRMISRRDIEEVVSNGTPFLFKSAIDTSRRMKAFLGTDGLNVPESGTATTVDIMKYILSYASNPTVSSERNGLFSRHVVDSSVRHLLHELTVASSRVSYGNIPSPGQQSADRRIASSNEYGPYIQMKRGDWICPKCNFMNFARNMKCLECEENRPKRVLVGSEWECPQCNFHNYGRNTMCLRCDHGRPGAPLRNITHSSPTENRFFTPSSDNKLVSHEANPEPASGFTASSSSSRILSEQSNGVQSSYSSSQNGYPHFQDGENNSNRVYQSVMDSERQMLSRENVVSGSSDETDPQNQELERAEKSERWFKKITELQNVKDTQNTLSVENSPDIMPMRRGENQFVVSKNNNRSMNSPKYKRQVAMDQASSPKFVPFVPFPPGYFARKEPVQSNSEDLSSNGVSANHDNEIEQLGDKSESSWDDGDKFSGETSSADNSKLPNVDVGHSNVAPAANFESISPGTSFSDKTTSKDGSSAYGATPPELPRSEIFHNGWTGPSLEGSAVKETDPLDMSEEAKAERWFKRVAQIKDISELSQIPDEDFPSIMPMRKGVNRFVVSKRKTPLERRLASQQYRRNLPIVTNDDLLKKTSEN